MIVLLEVSVIKLAFYLVQGARIPFLELCSCSGYKVTLTLTPTPTPTPIPNANPNSTKVLGILSDIFEEFDRLCEENDVDKIKTIGDAYVVCPEAGWAVRHGF